jgi:hypothetical protein
MTRNEFRLSACGLPTLYRLAAVEPKTQQLNCTPSTLIILCACVVPFLLLHLPEFLSNCSCLINMMDVNMISEWSMQCTRVRASVSAWLACSSTTAGAKPWLFNSSNLRPY